MKIKIIRFALSAVAATFLLASCSAQKAEAAKLPGPLVSAQWLKANLDGVTVLDVRTWPAGFTVAPEYKSEDSGKRLIRAGGHIEAAKLLDYDKIRVDREVQGQPVAKRVPTKAAFEKIIQSAGVDGDRPIVITNPGESFHEMDGAARVYWTLKYYGEDDVAILNGGNAAWLEAGFPVSTAKAESGGGDWKAGDVQTGLLAEIKDVENAVNNGQLLIDSRSIEQFLGVSKKSSVKAAGHVQGARNFPIDVHTRSEGIAAMFMSADDYGNLYRKLGIEPADNGIVYCNTGHLAAGAWFIAREIMGMENTRLYDGSMLEWTQFDKPVVGLAN